MYQKPVQIPVSQVPQPPMQIPVSQVPQPPVQIPVSQVPQSPAASPRARHFGPFESTDAFNLIMSFVFGPQELQLLHIWLHTGIENTTGQVSNGNRDPTWDRVALGLQTEPYIQRGPTYTSCRRGFKWESRPNVGV
ncbi:hypothetical protein TNCV_2748351 [Trichonephila clavipes]|nr:hypothetical protein TNCV_2748351 [Trichonephila clavipes]